MTKIRAVPPIPILSLDIPPPDAIRAAINATDERAKLLRRSLRIAMRLTTADTQSRSASAQVEVARG